MHPLTDLVVFSHLRWDFVWQRPQHLLTRLAADRRVFFVEEPLPSPDGEVSWLCRTPQDNLTVCQPRTPIDSPGYHPDQLPALRPLVRGLLEEHQIRDYQVWFYTPMAFPLLHELTPRGVIYDCMDELSAFRGAPPELLGLEADLLRRTDLVFTGGRSLYRAKKGRHPDVHCFPSSIDLSHFSKVRDGVEEPQDQASIPAPASASSA